jgi:ubiquinone/menaquinone biosynthesis C-methylase UbiE
VAAFRGKAVFDVANRVVASQLGNPAGPLGSIVARVLNRGNRPTIAAAVTALDLTDQETVADIGFGGGLGLDLLLAATSGVVHGVEPSPDMVKRAGRAHRGEVSSGRLQLHTATMDALPFDDASLDAWISLNTIYFIADLGTAFADLCRVLKPSGRGVIGMADPDWLGSRPFAKHGFIVRPADEVVGSLARAGFNVERRTVQASQSTGGGAAYTLLVCRPR